MTPVIVTYTRLYTQHQEHEVIGQVWPEDGVTDPTGVHLLVLGEVVDDHLLTSTPYNETALFSAYHVLWDAERDALITREQMQEFWNNFARILVMRHDVSILAPDLVWRHFEYGEDHGLYA